jgi:flagellar biosynthesis GTPase FlhF
MTDITRWLKGAAAAASALFLASCYYDPYYSGGSYGGSGYGGGSYSSGGGLSTTFVYTSSDRWLYDPVVYCYYDRHRRCYYDPYLYGYYPVGYCPRPLHGAYHPHGWRPGSSYCPPPSNFRDRYLTNYQNRMANLKAANVAWAAKVHESNDRQAEAWRNQRARAAEKFQAARAQQSVRNQALRDQQAQRQQNIRDQQQALAGKPRPVPTAPQFQQRPAGRNPYAGGSAARQAQMENARARQQELNQARLQQRQERQQAQPQPRNEGNGGGGGGWKQKMQERRANRNP